MDKKELQKDKEKLQKQLNQMTQQYNVLGTNIIRIQGILAYIEDNLNNGKGEKNARQSVHSKGS